MVLLRQERCYQDHYHVTFNLDPADNGNVAPFFETSISLSYPIN